MESNVPVIKSGIEAVIPHRDPFLLIDEVIAFEPGVSAHALLHLSGEEPFFAGHFPGFPIMPGVLQLEALAQTGAFALLSMPEFKGKIALFGGAEKVKFRRGVKPGDILSLETTLLKISKIGGKGKGIAKVGDEICCEAEILFVFSR